MGVQERSEAQSNPLFAFFPANGGWDLLAQGYEPFARGLARCNLELMALMSRRAQAYLDIPSRVAQCRTPQDIANQQLRFWQTAMQQYAEGSRRVASIWMSMGVPAFSDGKGEAQRERDYISFPESKEAAPAAARKGGAERRAA
jgi:hypothetical protein